MNNDLSKLSDHEIELRKGDLVSANSCIGDLYREKKFIYQKTIKKRWASPSKILSLKKEMDDLEKAQYLLTEYSRTLTDEMNSRM